MGIRFTMIRRSAHDLIRKHGRFRTVRLHAVKNIAVRLNGIRAMEREYDTIDKLCERGSHWLDLMSERDKLDGKSCLFRNWMMRIRGSNHSKVKKKRKIDFSHIMRKIAILMMIYALFNC